MAALALAGVFSPWAVVSPYILFMVGFGIIMPQSMAGALAPYPHCAGAPSSLFGFLQMAVPALAGGLVGQFHDGTSRTMAIAIGLGGVLALLAYRGLVAPRGTVTLGSEVVGKTQWVSSDERK